ncbi:C-C motif chemokine 21-like isoform X2 [Sinocyclocheilus anshuiensis]|uniref:C-C motif chemokine 21-like isoform X2 n=1 Tax=Sinocyclocheilus anshuiensis TaxID=1608454 RepID=UPI0007BA1C4B|nr:PREDICTED: C-C motif chemokine 21-like isoform X2 [Sinocyclocheilus anshuiensis]
METRRILMRSLAVAVVIASVIWTTTGTEIVYSCCTKVSTAKVTDPIIEIRMQRLSLPCVKAVIFETEQGKFCSDPRQRWVEKKVKQFFKNTTPRPTSSISN